MTRPALWRAAVIIAATCVLGSCHLLRPGEAQDDSPNILWLTIEDTSCFLGCYGDPVAKTPHIDRLAARGVLFTRAFASSPVCSAARSALITGMHVGQLGVGNHRSRVAIPAGVIGFPQVLRQAGYYCTNRSKNDFNFVGAARFAAACWDDNSERAHWRNRPAGKPFFSVFNFVDSHQSRTAVNSYARFAKNIQAQLAPAEITSPDAVALPPFYRDSPRMRQAFARMYDCITLVDRQIGRVLRQLEADGLADDTIVFFFSDHGQGMPRFKTCPFGLGFRVPLIVHVPPKFRHLLPLAAGSTCEDLVSFVDLGPTVLDIVRAPIPETMRGRPVLGPGKARRDFFFGSVNDIDEAENHSRCVSDGDYLYIRNYMPHLPYAQPQLYCDSAAIMRYIREDHAAGLLTGAAAEFMAPDRPAEALYDLRQDPWEIRNLATDPRHRERLQALRAQNRQAILEVRDLHFLHAWEIETRGDGRPAADLRHDADLFPLERILAIAERNGMAGADLAAQLAALEDGEPMCRYWALLGLQARRPVTATILEAAARLLDDPAPYVRYEAAFLRCRYTDDGHARRILTAGIQESHSILVNHAMRKIALLGKRAAPFLAEVREVAKTYRQLRDRKKNSGVGASIRAIELCLSGRVPAANDDF